MLDTTNLAHFTGTLQYHRWSPLFPHIFLSDGAKYVADSGGKQGAYWLMDAIASYQPELRASNLAEFQVWTLETNTEDHTAELVCRVEDDMGRVIPISQEIEYTDFDLDKISLYTAPTYTEDAPGVKKMLIFLPSEY